MVTQAFDKHQMHTTAAFRNLQKAIRRIRGRNQIAMLKAGDFIKLKSMERTPVKTGFLQNSHYRQMVDEDPKHPVVQIGATAHYATVVHEHYPHGVRDNGVGMKFLERALLGHHKEILTVIRRTIKMSKVV